MEFTCELQVRRQTLRSHFLGWIGYETPCSMQVTLQGCLLSSSLSLSFGSFIFSSSGYFTSPSLSNLSLLRLLLCPSAKQLCDCHESRVAGHRCPAAGELCAVHCAPWTWEPASVRMQATGATALPRHRCGNQSDPLPALKFTSVRLDLSQPVSLQGHELVLWITGSIDSLWVRVWRVATVYSCQLFCFAFGVKVRRELAVCEWHLDRLFGDSIEKRMLKAVCCQLNPHLCLRLLKWQLISSLSFFRPNMRILSIEYWVVTSD